MSTAALQNRPPFVRFEVRAEEDREKSISEGHFVAKDVTFALITPAGSKDVVERVAEDWLKQITDQVKVGRFDPLWSKHYHELYRLWKDNEAAPESGIPLKNWPGVSPAQYESLKHANLRTVEDVAAMNEEAIVRVGMGARALKQRAIAYLETANGPGKIAEQNAALQQQNADLAAMVANLQKAVDELKAAQPANPTAALERAAALERPEFKL